MSQRQDWVMTAANPTLPWTPIPATAILPMLLWMVFPRGWTFMLALLVIVFFVALRVAGRNAVWLVRRLRSQARGRQMLARPIWYRRRMNTWRPATDLI